MRSIEELRSTPPTDMQDSFNRVVEFFFGHKKPKSSIPDPDSELEGSVKCQYRGKDTACAAGCQLPDSLYDPMFEGQAIDSMILNHEDWDEWFQAVPTDFINQLQKAHDQAHSVSEFRSGLRYLGNHYQLDLALLNDLPDYPFIR